MNSLFVPALSIDLIVHLLQEVNRFHIQYNYYCERNIPTKRYVIAESSDVAINPIRSTREGLALHTFGEQPSSFRNLIKRYQTVAEINQGAGIGLTNYTTTIPIYFAPDPPYSHTPTGTPYFNILGYLRYAYMGIRGSTRFRLREYANNDGLSALNVSLNVPATTIPSAISSSSSGSLPNATMTGTQPFCATVNPGVEYEVPYYNTNFFAFSFNKDPSGGYANDIYDKLQLWSTIYDCIGNLNYDERCKIDISVGEDFTLFHYQGAPFYTN